MTYFRFLLTIISLCVFTSANAQKVGILKYNGGGDWYANPTAVPNLIRFCNEKINTTINEKPETTTIESVEIFNYPIVFMTGHGNVVFSEEEAKNLKNYLISGGFLHISDNYGLNKYIRREMKKVFPNQNFTELPYDHPIFNQTFTFNKGLPKIHEHDNKAPQGFGLFYEGRLVCFFDFESDLSDGWEDAEVHNNSIELRTKALQMGANIIQYVFEK